MPTFAGELINAAVGVASLDDTALRGGYRVVADIAGRNAIDGSDFDKTGCLVHVQANGVTYQRTAAGWDAVSYTENTASDIYFALTGDDETGDGTIGNPFRTPQRCIDGLVDGQEGDVVFHALDNGPYDVPALTSVQAGPAGLGIMFGGNINQTPTAVIPTTSTRALIPGTAAQYAVTSNGFTDPITDGSHWMLDSTAGSPFFAFEFGLGSVPVASPSSPTINIITAFDFYIGLADIEIYPISTVFQTQGSQSIIGASGRGVTIKFAGIKFENVAAASFEIWESVEMWDCNLDGLTNALLFNFYNSSAFLASGEVNNQNLEDSPNSFIGGNLTRATAASGTMLLTSSKVSERVTVNPAGYMKTADPIDFDTAASTECIRVWNFGNGESRVEITVAMTVAGTYTSFLRCEEGSSSFIKGFGTGSITGSVSGTAWDLASRVTATGLGTVSGSLTSAADVQVGNAGTSTYAALPQNDFTSPDGLGTVVRS
ncbi:MAG: hypothetical protein HN738_02440 [Gammaproteobacteria bacterium]|nr:hypothetical protein [Gammaproteobacteria bacterium]